MGDFCETTQPPSLPLRRGFDFLKGTSPITKLHFYFQWDQISTS